MLVRLSGILKITISFFAQFPSNSLRNWDIDSKADRIDRRVGNKAYEVNPVKSLKVTGRVMRFFDRNYVQ
jgi:hypothetical protein